MSPVRCCSSAHVRQLTPGLGALLHSSRQVYRAVLRSLPQPPPHIAEGRKRDASSHRLQPMPLRVPVTPQLLLLPPRVDDASAPAPATTPQLLLLPPRVDDASAPAPATEGRRRLSSWSCHRGSTRRLSSWSCHRGSTQRLSSCSCHRGWVG
ncbi:hypothetical protein CRENBAI_025780 [Crenichthys baileyi]|uniref:Uncharacterized protein n=1 Tax=Crenichthys baileyi TaxID=28760 RepID=A0AAV9SEB9_9TELE